LVRGESDVCPDLTSPATRNPGPFSSRFPLLEAVGVVGFPTAQTRPPGKDRVEGRGALPGPTRRPGTRPRPALAPTGRGRMRRAAAVRFLGFRSPFSSPVTFFFFRDQSARIGGGSSLETGARGQSRFDMGQTESLGPLLRPRCLESHHGGSSVARRHPSSSLEPSRTPGAQPASALTAL
jgi:hypothetical protein